MTKRYHQSSIEDSHISAKQLNYLNLFWIGFIIYTISYVLKRNLQLSSKLTDYGEILGLIMCLPTAFMLIRFEIRNKYLKFLFISYCIWTLIIIFRGISFDLNFLRNSLLDAKFGILLYVAPLILLFPKYPVYFRRLFDTIIILGICLIALDLLLLPRLLERSRETQEVIEYLTWFLSLPCGFLLLTYKYHSKKRIVLALTVMIITLLFSIYKARRGLSFMQITILTYYYFLYLSNTKNSVIILYLTLLIIALGLLYASSIYQIHDNKLLSFIAEKGEKDTRTGVELYFYDDMKTMDWLIGRGINGEYFCPYFSELTDYRILIETGYLQIILKGGIIRLGLYLLISVPAIILGLFNSKNLLSKAAAIWIIVGLISLYPATMESFSLTYLLVWISIGICYSKEIRQLSDKKIETFLKPYANKNTF